MNSVVALGVHAHGLDLALYVFAAIAFLVALIVALLGRAYWAAAASLGLLLWVVATFLH